MPTTAASRRALQRIARICEDSRNSDASALRLRVLDELRTIVGFDWHVWLLTDPQTWVGSAPEATIPPRLLPQLARLIRLKYLTEVNRWTALATPVASLADTTGGELSRSLVWRALLTDHDVTDLASLVFTDRYGCWGFLDLWRTAPAAPFTSDDLAVLTPHRRARDDRAASLPGRRLRPRHGPADTSDRTRRAAAVTRPAHARADTRDV